jgi:hypothetical protein
LGSPRLLVGFMLLVLGFTPVIGGIHVTRSWVHPGYWWGSCYSFLGSPRLLVGFMLLILAFIPVIGGVHVNARMSNMQPTNNRRERKNE